MRKRTQARHSALEVLYQVDLCGIDTLDEALSDMYERSEDDESANFATDLVRGTLSDMEALDKVIREVAKNWDLGRMPTIDRNILRIGAYELLHREDIPPKVSINEAIELAKCYSTAESGTFVNGILDNIKNTHRKSEDDVDADVATNADSETVIGANADTDADTDTGVEEVTS